MGTLEARLRPLLLVSALLFSGATGPAPGQDARTEAGTWRAWLEAPGGELPFGLVLEPREQAPGWRAVVRNGPEAIAVPTVAWDGETLLLGFDHYDSRIRASRGPGGALHGTWEKHLGPGRSARMAFHATPCAADDAARFLPLAASAPPADLSGRWSVAFESDPLPAVAVFEQTGGVLSGTFLTATGDYRTLAGDVTGERLRLSVFDGAHAFLFHASLDAEGRLEGDFWSRDSWHETWSARRDAAAALPDPFAQTTWDEGVSLAELVVPDLSGTLRSLGAPEYAGRAIVLQLFGSWCPNCHDEGAYLAELDRRYRERGLSILGLAFELDGDLERDAAQVRRYAERHGCEYPFFVVGSAESKAVASQAFPAIDRLRSYPTTVFLHGDGRVRAVHSGFAGPATGPEHQALRREFEGLIEELLAEPGGESQAWSLLASDTWEQELVDGGSALAFHERDGARRATLAGEELPVALNGQAVRVGERLLRLDRSARLLRDPLDVGLRWRRAGDPPHVLLRERGLAPGDPASAADDADPLVRAEALVAALEARTLAPPALAALLARGLQDPDPRVQATAAWGAGRARAAACLPALEAGLACPNAGVRREAVRAWGRIPGADRARLLELARDSDPLVRSRVAELVE